MNQDSRQDYLLGYLSFEGIKQESPKYAQGVGINFYVELKENDRRVRFDDYSLVVILKADLLDNCPVWTGAKGFGIVKDEERVKIKIPENVTVNLLPGTYYLSVLGTSVKDLTHNVVLADEIFTIKSTAADQPVSGPFTVVSINNNPLPLPNEGPIIDIGYTGNL